MILGLQRATHATLGALTRRLAVLDLGPSEISVLANLDRAQPVSVGALATATATRPTTLTSVLDRLAGRGLVTRELDPADRRSFLVSLTPPGSLAAAQVAAAVRDLEEQALSGVTLAQRAGFAAVVRAFSEVPR